MKYQQTSGTDANMIHFMTRFKALWRDRSGVTALEYGIIAGVLGLVLISIFRSFGSTISTVFVRIGGSI